MKAEFIIITIAVRLICWKYLSTRSTRKTIDSKLNTKIRSENIATYPFC